MHVIRNVNVTLCNLRPKIHNELGVITLHTKNIIIILISVLIQQTIYKIAKFSAGVITKKFYIDLLVTEAAVCILTRKMILYENNFQYQIE